MSDLCRSCHEKPIRCRNMCNTCYGRWWREHNQDHYKEYQRTYAEKRRNDPIRKAKVRDYSRNSYLRNREKVLIRSHIRYHANPQERRNWERNWIERNREKKRAAFRRWEYRKRSNGDCNVTFEEWEFIKALWLHSCIYCGENEKPLTQDHIIPLSKGGKDEIKNVVPACKSCNSSKGNKTLAEWIYDRFTKSNHRLVNVSSS